MAEDDQRKVLEELFKTMTTWTREKMRDWIDEIMGDDESMKPVIDQLYERKDITNAELIEFFRGMLMGGEEAPQEETPPKTKKTKAEPKASKKEKKKPPPSYASSSSSAASEKIVRKKAKKRKYVPSENSSSDGESDATVDLSISKKHKTDKGKRDIIPPHKIKKEKKEVPKKSKPKKYDSDEDSDDFQPKKKHSGKVKIKQEKRDTSSSERERYKSDKHKEDRAKKDKSKSSIDRFMKNEDVDKWRKSTDKERYDKSYTDRDKTDKAIKVEGDSGKAKQSHWDKSSDNRDPSKDRDKTDKLEKHKDRDKAHKSKAEREKEKERTDKDRVEKARLEKERTDKEREKARRDKERTEKERAEKSRVDKEKAEKERSDKEKAEKAKSDKDKADKERSDKEKAEKDRAERARVEKERTDKDKAEKDRSAKERAEKERADKERAEKERTDKERIEKERTDKERTDGERTDKERTERERTDKERIERERTDKERTEKERTDKERVEKERTDKEKSQKAEKEKHKADREEQDKPADKSEKTPAKPDHPKEKPEREPHKVDKVTKPEKTQKYIDLSQDHFELKDSKPQNSDRPKGHKRETDKLKRISTDTENFDVITDLDILNLNKPTDLVTPQVPLQTQFPPPKNDLQCQFPRPKECLQSQFPKPREVIGPVVRSRNSPIYLDPEYSRYQKEFKLRPVTVTLYEIRRQSHHWREGDQVYRTQQAEERRKRKEQRKLEERKEKYSERGTRILPFEKRPENAELFRKKGEITREKPKVETPTEKQQRLMELHRKDRDREKEKKIKTINTEFKIPKKGEKKKHHHPVIQDQHVSSFTPLAPAAKLDMRFDKKRLVIPAKDDTWGLTPEEERALERKNKPPPAAAAGAPPEKKDRVVDLTEDDLGDFAVQDDDFQGAPDLEPDGEEPDGSFCYSGPAPPPITDVMVNELSKGMVGIMALEDKIEPPPEDANHAEVIMRKCAKWFRYAETEPYFQTCPSIPEQHEENFYTLMKSMETVGDDVSSVGNVSNPDGEDHDLQDSEITSTAIDPDVADEHCGAALLDAQIRVKAGEEKDCFKNIFHMRRGCNYNKENFQAKCNLCEELILDKRHLGAHVRSTSHRANMAATSLKLVGLESKLAKPVSPTETVTSVTSKSSEKSRSTTKEKEIKSDKEKTRVKSGDTEKNGKTVVVVKEKAKDDKKAKTDPAKVKRTSSGSSHTTLPPGVKKPEDKTRARRRSRSRSPSKRKRSRSVSRGRRSRSRSRSRRSPHRRSRSRSPRRHHHHRRSRSRSRSRGGRRDSKDAIDAFLAENARASRGDSRRSPPKKGGVPSESIVKGKQETSAIFNERLKLQAAGKWTTQLEARWKLWEEEEERIKRIFAQKRKMLEEKPEDHPKYSDEWPKFWEKRYQELTEKGVDAETYDYAPEWKVYWGKLSEAFLDREMAMEMQDVRLKYGMDLETLKALNAAETVAPLPPTAPPVQQLISQGAYGVPPPAPYMSGQPLPPGVHSYTLPAVVSMPVSAPLGMVPNPTTTYPGVMSYGVPPPVVHVTPLHTAQAAVAAGVAAPIVPKPSTIVSGRVALDDYTAKPMSISSGGSNISPYSNRAGNLAAAPAPAAPAPKVTIDDVGKIWENLTGSKIQQAIVEKAKSVASGTSNKSKDYDFDGGDVVEVLRLMTGLEDELSFLAIKVLDYYKMAEQMEAEEPRKSFTLLKDLDFVTLLHQCRDKFFAILRANVSSSEVMKKLNITTYAMNALIDLPICQKIKPSAPPNPQKETPTPDPPLPVARVVDLFRNSAPTTLVLEPVTAPPPPKVPVTSQVFRNRIEAALVEVPMHKKIEMSSVIAHSLLAQGKDRLSQAELMTTLLQIMAPIISTMDRRLDGSPGPSSSSRRSNVGEPPLGPIPGPPSGTGSFGGTFDRERDRRFNDEYTRAPAPGSSYRNYSSGALDLFPEIRARAVSPPHPPVETAPVQEPQSFGLSSFLPNLYRGGGGGGRRDYMGNPVPQDQDTPKEPEAPPQTKELEDLSFHRPRKNKHSSPRSAYPVEIDIDALYPDTSKIARRIEPEPEVIVLEEDEGVVKDDGIPGGSRKQHLPPGILNLIEKERKKSTSENPNPTSSQKLVVISAQEGNKSEGKVKGHIPPSDLSVVSGLSGVSSSTSKSGGRKRRVGKDSSKKVKAKDAKLVSRKQRDRAGHKPGDVRKVKDRDKSHKKKKVKDKEKSKKKKEKRPEHEASRSKSREHHVRRSSIGSHSHYSDEKPVRRSSFVTEYDRRHPPPPPSDSSSVSLSRIRVAPRRISSSASACTNGSLPTGGSKSKRHHRSSPKKEKRSSKNKGSHEQAKISGVSHSFWEPAGSVVSSEENFEESGRKRSMDSGDNVPGALSARRGSDKSQSSYRKTGQGLVNDHNGDTEEGEIISSSESFCD